MTSLVMLVVQPLKEIVAALPLFRLLLIVLLTWAPLEL